jgi:P pilus assembly chaperone PapD
LNPEYSVYRLNSIGSLNKVNVNNLSKYHIGLSGGTGVQYIFENSSYIYLKSEFEYRIPANDDSQIIDLQYVNSLKINFGYGFPIN